MDVSEFQAGNLALIHQAVEAFARRPTLTEAQQKARGDAVIRAIAGFMPFEPVQTILAIEAVGHHVALLDTFRDLGSGKLNEAQTARARIASMGQTRSFLSVVKELRTVRQERLALYREEEAAERSRAARDAEATEDNSDIAMPPAETGAAAVGLALPEGQDPAPERQAAADPAMAAGAQPATADSGRSPRNGSESPYRQVGPRPPSVSAEVAPTESAPRPPIGDATFQRNAAELAKALDAAREASREASAAASRGPSLRDAADAMAGRGQSAARKPALAATG